MGYLAKNSWSGDLLNAMRSFVTYGTTSQIEAGSHKSEKINDLSSVFPILRGGLVAQK